ncbi:hypothetical protein Naga_100035g24 [Nannochloropsis gaditana]|uniref:Uncharacterized protein n=1 Tax=Nannochloropsis gaditana TaxID=72520 RepID=W7UB03_9STRA|nr:hypothetical protein Naga_100035g24 [Nannochloropsis gaditana]
MYALACLRTMRAVALAEEAASRRRARSPGGGYARQGFTFMTPQGQDTQKADQAPADERHPMKKSSQFSSFGKVNGTEEEKKDTPLDDPQAHLSQIVEASDDSKPIFKDTACLKPERIVLRIPPVSSGTSLERRF